MAILLPLDAVLSKYISHTQILVHLVTLLSGFFPRTSPIRIMHTFIVSSTAVHVSLSVSSLIYTITVQAELLNFQHSSLCGVFFSQSNAYLLDPYIFLSSLFSCACVYSSPILKDYIHTHIKQPTYSQVVA
jgi:hypothetical protein